MLTMIVVSGLIVIGALVVLVMTQPDTFSVTREIQVAAPREKIAPLIRDFHEWTKWSPWEQLDPAMKRTYAGATSGKGAIYSWESAKAGAGRMEVLADAANKIDIQLDFTKPMVAHNLTEFSLDPEAGGTKITWAMSGVNNVMSKAMHAVMSMDKLVGGDFEKGLASLKALAEG